MTDDGSGSLLLPADPAKAFTVNKTIWGPKSSGFGVLSHGQLIWLPNKETGELELKTLEWHDHFFPWPSATEALREFLATPQHELACKAREGEGWNLYFCPILFTQQRRHKGYAIAPRWLWSDLDEADPRNFPFDVPQPTLTFETSPGRYHGLWHLDRPIEPARAAMLSKGVAYRVGADKGGWDLTQVLRLPYTYNSKYDPPFEVRLNAITYQEGTKKLATYSPEDFSNLAVQMLHAPTDGDVQELLDDAMGLSSIEILRKHKLTGKLKQKTLDFLQQEPKRGDDRSKKLFELECLLFESGLSAPEIYTVVSDCPWNKFATDNRDGDVEWLAKDVLKATHKVETESDIKIIIEGEVPDDPFIEGCLFLSTPVEHPGWLIENLIPAHEQLMISGEQQTMKSIISTDIAVSVATGTLCFDTFEVKRPGKVLLLQEENTTWMMQNRILKMAGQKNVAANDPRMNNLFFLNCFGLDLTDEGHREMIERKIALTGCELVIFDPLYLMLGAANENDATELRPIIRWFIELGKRFPVAVIVVHHNNKNGEVRGSSILAAWRGNSLSLAHFDKANAIVKIDRAYRGYASRAPMTIKFELDDAPGLLYKTHVKLTNIDKNATVEAMKKLITEAPIKEGITVNALAKKVGIMPDMALKYVDILVANHFCSLEKDARGKTKRVTLRVAEIYRDAQIELDEGDDNEDGESLGDAE